MKKYKNIFCASILFIGILVCIKMYLFSTIYNVMIDNQIIGSIKNKNDLTNIINNIKDNVKKEHNQDIIIKESIEVKKVFGNNNNVMTYKELEKKLSSLITLQMNGIAINIDGVDKLYVSNDKIANDVLNDIKSNYKSSNDIELGFLEDVILKSKNIDISLIKSKEEAKLFLLTGGKNVSKYIVKQGDTSWKIARDNNIRVKDIKDANPKLDVEKLNLGDEIDIVLSEPLLNVKSVTNAEYEKPIPFDIVYEDTEYLFKGEKKVKMQGLQGKKSVKSQVLRVNGKWVSETILNEDVLEQSQNQIILNGTKEKPIYIASNIFDNPTRGTLSSKFGERWGKNHKGIDIAGAIGTPIYVVDGGVVEYSGTMNGYGNVVIVNHKNGYKTYYGHCSKLLVSSGEKLGKGDLIAKMGNTGRTTGSHLHFEVRKNDIPLNPLEYVNY